MEKKLIVDYKVVGEEKKGASEVIVAFVCIVARLDERG